MVQTIQSNNMPGGGVTAQQPVQPTGNMTPAQVVAIVESLSPIQARFRQQSSFLHIALPQANFGTALGTPQSATITNVGLAVRLETEWNVVIEVQNGATSAQTFAVSPWFPYNLIANTAIAINGGAYIYSCSGIADLSVMTRQRRGSKRFVSEQTGWNTAFGVSLDPALLQVNTLGSNLTPTNSTTIAPAISGIASVSVAGSAGAGATSRWTLRFVTFERIVQDRNSMLGAPPLQNNATFVQVVRNLQSALSGARNDGRMPFSSAGANLTFALISATADTTYEFASVPGDPSLYAALVSNSFQSQEQQGFTVAATGVEAFNYAIPTNQFLVALHNIGVDTNGAAVKPFDVTNGLGLLKIQYSGASVIPVRNFPYRDRAEQFLDYDCDPQAFPSCRIWDGERSSDDITASDNMMWLDCYSTSSPQEVIDVGTAASPTLTFSITRESVIVGATQQVGG